MTGKVDTAHPLWMQHQGWEKSPFLMSSGKSSLHTQDSAVTEQIVVTSSRILGLASLLGALWQLN